jgi:hypothetical protein
VDSPTTIAVRDGGVFGKQVAVLGVQVNPAGPGVADLSILLRSDKEVDPQAMLAVHLNDRSGRVIDKAGDLRLEPSGRSVPAGRTWIARHRLSQEALGKAASIGIAMYVTPAALFGVSGAQTDWGGRRLILPLGQPSLSDEQIAEFVASPRTTAVRHGGVFGKQVAVLGVQMNESGPDEVDVSILLRSEKDIDPRAMLAVHLNDANGKIIDKPGDRRLELSSRGIPAGRTWIADYAVKKESFRKAASIGIAVYVTPASLFHVSGPRTDWGGRRLILPTPG